MLNIKSLFFVWQNILCKITKIMIIGVVNNPSSKPKDIASTPFDDENNVEEVEACLILFFHVLFIGSLRSRN